MISINNFSQLRRKTNKQNPRPHKPGFTIIEVVLVLAIAGLIFLMVFIALPALQRSQRDAQRKNDISRLQAAIESYKSNNRGRLPWTSSDTLWVYSTPFYNDYLKANQGQWKDPTGKEYRVSINNINVVNTGIEGWRHPGYGSYDNRTDGHENGYYIFVFVGYKCNGVSATKAAGDNKYAIFYGPESGGSACVDG